MKIEINTYCSGKDDLPRLRAFRKVMQQAIKSLSPYFKQIKAYKITVQALHGCLYRLGDNDIAAYQSGGNLTFLNRKNDEWPDVESLTWLLEHEISHFHLSHAHSGKSPQTMEAEAIELQRQHGIPWHNGLIYKSTNI